MYKTSIWCFSLLLILSLHDDFNKDGTISFALADSRNDHQENSAVEFSNGLNTAVRDVDNEEDEVLIRFARSPDARADPKPKGGRGGSRGRFSSRRSYSRRSYYRGSASTSKNASITLIFTAVLVFLISLRN